MKASYLYFICAFGICVFSFTPTNYFKIRTTNINQNSRIYAANEVTTGSDSDKEYSENEMTKMVELIVSSLEEGREEDLQKAGLKVTKKSARETMDVKLNDPDIQRSVLGSMSSEDEKEIMNMLQQALENDTTATTNTNVSTEMIDEALLNEFKQEAMETLQNIRAKGKSAMGTLLQDEESFGGVLSSSSNSMSSPINSFTEDSVSNDRKIDASVWGNTKGVESILSPIDTTKYPDWVSNDSNQEGVPQRGEGMMEESEIIENGNSNTSSEENPATSLYNSNNGGSSSNGNSNGSNSNHYELPIKSVESDVKVATTDSTSTTSTTADAPSTPTLNLFLNNENHAADSSMEDKFAALLKASLAMQQIQTESENDLDPETIADTRRKTMDAVTTGKVEGLDIDTLLGNTMATLAKQLDVNLVETLQEPQSMNDMKMILGQSMKELTEGLKEVDEQSATLYKKLDTLSDELRNETDTFQQTKQMELDLFMQSQKAFESEVILSKKRMQNSTDTLKNLIQNLEEEADLISALALFPLKTTDKKVAFVFGLALVFKVPFDALQVALNSLDSSDWFGVLVQAGVCLACLNHYGIIKALFKKSPQPS